MRLRRRYAGLLLIAWFWSSLGACVADDGAAFKPREFGATRVFRIQTDINNGSAVLLDANGGKALFATCFHIMSDCQRFALLDISEMPIGTDGEAEVLRRWDRDLVLIRVPMVGTQSRGGLNPGEVPIVEGARELPNGYAFGYANARDLKDVKLRFINRPLVLADLDAFEEQTFRPTGDDIDVAGFKVRELSDAITFRGMSGGLVIDEKRRFGGLIFGQLSTGQSLMIPAEDVIETLKQAVVQKATKFVPFDRSIFRAPPPFSGPVQDDLGILSLRCEADLSQVAELVAKDRFTELSDKLKDTRVQWKGIVDSADKRFTMQYVVMADNDGKGALRVRLLLKDRDKFVKKKSGDAISFEGEVYSFPKSEKDAKIIFITDVKIRK